MKPSTERAFLMADGKKAKVQKVMREFEAGELRSSSGQLVTSREQALAIALSEAGMSKDEYENG